MFLGLITLQAQDFTPKSSATIHQSIQQLNFLGNVLYIAAPSPRKQIKYRPKTRISNLFTSTPLPCLSCKNLVFLPII